MSGAAGDSPALYDRFRTIAGSVLWRLYRQRAADAALFRLVSTQFSFWLVDAEGRLCGQAGCEQVFEEHRRVKADGITMLDVTYSESTIISSLSVFDSFLSDLTRFLLLMHPRAVSPDRTIRFGDALAASDLSAVIDSVISKFVHELSYKCITERINYLSHTFGIDLSSISEQIATLQSFADLRNRLVHDTSSFRYVAAPIDGELEVFPNCDRAKASWQTAEEVVSTCLVVADSIFALTCKHIFGREPDIRFLLDEDSEADSAREPGHGDRLTDDGCG